MNNKKPTKKEIMGTPYTHEGEGKDKFALYSEFDVIKIMDDWGKIKWDEAQHDAMQFNKNRNSNCPQKYPVGTFTPYKK